MHYAFCVASLNFAQLERTITPLFKNEEINSTKLFRIIKPNKEIPWSHLLNLASKKAIAYFEASEVQGISQGYNALEDLRSLYYITRGVTLHHFGEKELGNMLMSVGLEEYNNISRLKEIANALLSKVLYVFIAS